MVAIPLPVTSAPGARPYEGAGRLVNCYAEPLKGRKGEHVRRRAPGLRAFGTAITSGYRGAFLNGSTLFVAENGKVEKYTSSGGAAVAVGNLAGTKRVSWARNNNATPDLVVVDVDNGAFNVTSSAVTSFADSDLPQPTDVCFLDGYLIFGIADRRVFATGINAVTINALDFTTCDSTPGALLRTIAWNDRLWVFKTDGCDIFTDTANPTGFPFSKEVSVPMGLLARNCIAGHEEGFKKSLIFVGHDRCVYAMNGYSPQKISTPDIDRAIEGVTDTSTLQAGVYNVGGHPCWVLSCPAFTWVFDLSTTWWHERHSDGLTYWRAKAPVWAFGKWLAGDSSNGNIVEITDAVYKDITSPIMWEVWSGPTPSFPKRYRVPGAKFNFDTGVGDATGTDPVETDPVVDISISKDGGYTFSPSLHRKLGRQSVADNIVRVPQMGMGGPNGVIWRLRGSAAVYLGLLNGDMEVKA